MMIGLIRLHELGLCVLKILGGQEILAFLSIPGFDMVVISSMVTLSESDNETDVASRHIIECDEVNSSQIMTSSLCSRFSMDRNDIPQHASSNIFQIILNIVCNGSSHMITNPELLNRKRGAPGSEGGKPKIKKQRMNKMKIDHALLPQQIFPDSFVRGAKNSKNYYT
ncbi:hypothetical protein ZOSMA_38G00830 [Zostera marina]|uniref:Uncharacterized protein n=1 Tax=Zostera marina TaxID=29655 RepID=A0A0K9P4P1_ZOSMR|nr:hypothetical protein ZOSMA_38G00830 [Zostera marina]